MSIDWTLIRTAQIEGLATVAKEAGTKALVITIAPDYVIWVVGTSQYDPRRWNIGRDGHVSRCKRESGKVCRGNKFPKLLIEQARAAGANVAIQDVTSAGR